MRVCLATLLLLLASCSALPTSQAPPATTQRIQVYVGERMLDENDWEPVEDQGTFGAEYSFEPADSFGWEIGLLASADSDDIRILGIDAEVDGRTQELYGGLRKTFGAPEARFAPYLGGGLSLLTAELEVEALGQKEDEDDSSIAGYAHAGVTVDVTESFFVGVELRVLFGSDLEFGDVEGDGDYEQLALVLGFGF